MRRFALFSLVAWLVTVPLFAAGIPTADELFARSVSRLVGVFDVDARESTEFRTTLEFTRSEGLPKAFRELNVASAEELIAAEGLLGALVALNGTTTGATEEIAKLFDQVRGLSGELALTGRGLQTFADAQQRIIESTANLSSEKGLGVLAKDGQVVDRAFNKLAVTFKQEVGESLIGLAANSIRAADAVGGDLTEGIIAAGRVGLPIIGNLTVGVGLFAAAMEHVHRARRPPGRRKRAFRREIGCRRKSQRWGRQGFQRGAKSLDRAREILGLRPAALQPVDRDQYALKGGVVTSPAQQADQSEEIARAAAEAKHPARFAALFGKLAG